MKLDLLWSEEFEGQDCINEDVWNFDQGDGTNEGIPGWGNNEREFYTVESVTMKSGLQINATRLLPNTGPDSYYGPTEWTSGKIHTAGKVNFKFGRLEIIAKPPLGGGTWPAIWMLGKSIASAGWPLCGEIDIFEGAGNRPNQVCGTIHGPGYSGADGIGVSVELEEPIANTFHTFTLDWLPDQISWLIDGKVYSTLHRDSAIGKEQLWPFNDYFYLIINLAMGGWFAGDIAPGFDRATFSIKSIKYYSIDGVGKVELS